ncbi:hypothetical protein [Lactococcus lactis]|uniref:hypothetical protein n=1 Tax=Lactococcus lactis TaxID=1358 RepID=UPI0035BC878C
MSRYSDYKHANEILRSIEKNPEKYLIIHYSCESFFNLKGKSPRIASISVRQYNNAQTNNFSIHQVAEQLNMTITDENYLKIEKKLLDDFFKFVEKKSDDKIWLHWNMRDSIFGFGALELRYKILKGNPTIIDNDKKVDIGHLFKQYYGEGYIGDSHIKMLSEKNEFNPRNFLNGTQEAAAFKNKEYVKLSLSTSSKVNLFSSFITYAVNNNLLTNTSKWKMRGTNISGLYSTFEESRFGKIVIGLILMIIGGVIGAIISNLI